LILSPFLFYFSIKPLAQKYHWQYRQKRKGCFVAYYTAIVEDAPETLLYKHSSIISIIGAQVHPFPNDGSQKVKKIIGAI